MARGAMPHPASVRLQRDAVAQRTPEDPQIHLEAVQVRRVEVLVLSEVINELPEERLTGSASNGSR